MSYHRLVAYTIPVPECVTSFMAGHLFTKVNAETKRSAADLRLNTVTVFGEQGAQRRAFLGACEKDTMALTVKKTAWAGVRS
jgi:hypothetical protein